MFKLMGKKLMALLRNKNLLNWPYDTKLLRGCFTPNELLIVSQSTGVVAFYHMTSRLGVI